MASSALLAQIQSGRALKKAVTNDRSAPKVEGIKPSVNTGGGGGGGGGSSLSNGSVSAGGGGGGGGSGGPPQLGGLFAGGMPKLKPSSTNTHPKIANMAKPPSIPKNVLSMASPTSPASPPPPPPGPPSTISRAVPPPPSRTAPPGPGRAVPPPPAAPSSTTPSRAVPPPPTRSTTIPAPPPPPPTAPTLPARSVPPPPTPTSPPSSTLGRAVPPPPSRTLPPSTPSSTTVEAPNSAVHNVYGRTPTSATGRDSPVSTPFRSVPPPPSTSGRKVPPPPPPRGGGGAGSMSDTGAMPRRLAPPPPPARPLSASGTGLPPPSRVIPPPARVVPPPVRTRVQSAVSPTSAASDTELENAIVARISQDSPSVGLGPPPLPGGRRGGHLRGVSGGDPSDSAAGAGHVKTGSWSRSAAGAPPRSSSYGGVNMRHAVADSGSTKRIPSPPPMSGQYRFPSSTDFPKPRAFEKGAKNYPSGRTKGSDFDLSVIG